VVEHGIRNFGDIPFSCSSLLLLGSLSFSSPSSDCLGISFTLSSFDSFFLQASFFFLCLFFYSFFFFKYSIRVAICFPFAHLTPKSRDFFFLYVSNFTLAFYAVPPPPPTRKATTSAGGAAAGSATVSALWQQDDDFRCRMPHRMHTPLSRNCCNTL